MAQKVWVYTSIEFSDGEFSYEQEVRKDRGEAETDWGERVADIGFALEDMGVEDEDIEVKYDAENLYYEMRHNGDYCLVFVEEYEV